MGFLNRIRELQSLSKMAPKPGRPNQLTFLFSPTAIGKSELTRELIRQHFQHAGVKIGVLTGPSAAQEPGFLLRDLVAAFDDRARDAQILPTFAQFLNRSRHRTVRYRHVGSTYGSALQSLSRISKWTNSIYESIKSLVRPRDEPVLYSGRPDQLILFTEYLKYCLADGGFVINIENIQVVDKVSLDQLRYIVRTTRGNLFLFEYTISEERSAQHVKRLADYFLVDDVTVALRELERLPLAEALRLRGLPDRQVRPLLTDIYTRGRGNLRELIDLDVLLASNLSVVDSLDESATRLNVDRLTTPAKQLLALVAAHPAPVTRKELAEVLGSASVRLTPADLESAVALLESRLLLKSEGTQLQVGQDWVKETVAAMQSLAGFRVSADLAWTEYYERVRESPGKEAGPLRPMLYRLAHFYARAEPIKLVKLLPELKVAAAASLNAESAIEYMRSLERVLEADGVHTYLEEVRFGLLEIYYYLGLFEQALETLSEIGAETRSTVAYRAMLLNRIDRHEDTLEYACTELELEGSQDSRLFLVLSLIQVLSLRTLGQLRRARTVFESLLDGANFADCPEYGYLLRSADIVMPSLEAQPHLRSSVEFFGLRGNEVAEAHSRIGLSESCARLGDLREATRELDRAEEILGKRTLERHVVYNNRAALELLDRRDPQRAVDLLLLALTTTTTVFDRLVISYNLSTSYSLAGDSRAVSRIVEEVQELATQEPDKVERTRALYSAAEALRRVGRNCEGDALLQELPARAGEIDELWAHRLQGAPVADANYRFLSTFSFHPGLINYWHFPIARDL